jgi:hypothetical protein
MPLVNLGLTLERKHRMMMVGGLIRKCWVLEQWLWPCFGLCAQVRVFDVQKFSAPRVTGRR